jgi:hypothetical protein
MCFRATCFRATRILPVQSISRFAIILFHWDQSTILSCDEPFSRDGQKPRQKGRWKA